MNYIKNNTQKWKFKLATHHPAKKYIANQIKAT